MHSTSSAHQEPQNDATNVSAPCSTIKSLHCVLLLNTIHGFPSGPTAKYWTMPLNRLWPLPLKVLPVHLSLYYTKLQAIKSYGLCHLQQNDPYMGRRGCWVQFPNDAAYASASCGQYRTAIFEFFSVGFAYFFVF